MLVGSYDPKFREACVVFDFAFWKGLNKEHAPYESGSYIVRNDDAAKGITRDHDPNIDAQRKT